jgi:hypothetical protein
VYVHDRWKHNGREAAATQHDGSQVEVTVSDDDDDCDDGQRKKIIKNNNNNDNKLKK